MTPAKVTIDRGLREAAGEIFCFMATEEPFPKAFWTKVYWNKARTSLRADTAHRFSSIAALIEKSSSIEKYKR